MIDDEEDHVTVSPIGGIALPTEWIGYTTRVDFTQRICLRVSWIGVSAGHTRTWKFAVWKISGG